MASRCRASARCRRTAPYMRGRIQEDSVRGGQSARIVIRCSRSRWPSYSCSPVCPVQTIHSEPIRDSESIHSRTQQRAVLNVPKLPRGMHCENSPVRRCFVQVSKSIQLV